MKRAPCSAPSLWYVARHRLTRKLCSIVSQKAVRHARTVHDPEQLETSQHRYSCWPMVIAATLDAVEQNFTVVTTPEVTSVKSA